MVPEKNLQLAGIISYGGRSSSVFYQMWFSEHHPDMCSVGPSERWLEHAAWRFSHDIANEKHLYTGISGSFLREYATHAVRDFIVDEMNLKLGMGYPTACLSDTRRNSEYLQHKRGRCLAQGAAHIYRPIRIAASQFCYAFSGNGTAEYR